MSKIITVIIKPINKREIMDAHYREFDDVESIDDDHYPLIKIRHKGYQCYALIKVPDNCYLLVLNDDK